MSEEAYPDALPVGHRLHWYTLEHVLGQGGFGITYLARDTNLDRPVAIKEYLPADYARRDDTATVRPRSESLAERYAWGLERFANEARTLARFDHPNIVRVHSVFEANNTAYMVMRFEEGENLSRLLDRLGTAPERQLTDCLLAILDGLQLVHDAGFIHRDIKPENIYMRRDGTPVLLDFGSARQALGQAKTMTILVAPGYAPLEQYYGDPVSQGPWTDIYGLGATCYRAITGQAPMDAVARAKGVLGSARELLQSAADAGRGRYSARFLLAIDHALQLNERDRPQSIAAWRRELLPPTEGLAPVAPVAPAAGPAPPAWHAPVGGIAAPLAAPAAAPGVSLPSAAPVASLTAPVAVAASAGLAAPVPAIGPPPQAEPRVAGPATVAESVPLTPAPSPRSSWPLIAAGALLGVAGMSVVMFARSPGDTQGVPAPPVPASDAASKPRPPDPSPPAPAIPAPPPPAPAASQHPGASSKPINRPPPAPPGKTSSDPQPRLPAPSASSPPTQPPAQEPQRVLPKQEPTPAPTPASAPASSPGPSPAASTPPAAPPPPPPPKAAPPAAPPAVDVAARRRDDQIKAAEVALQSGNTAAAIDLLTPLADAGIAHAQFQLGRALEARSGRIPSNRAYMWFSLAARQGEPGAAAARDREAARLLPADVLQADRLIDHWKPHAPSYSGPLR